MASEFRDVSAGKGVLKPENKLNILHSTNVYISNCNYNLFKTLNIDFFKTNFYNFLISVVILIKLHTGFIKSKTTKIRNLKPE